jgi:tRNA G26 N,N-dimethylase Trm1
MKKKPTRQIVTTISNQHLNNTTIESLNTIFKCSKCNKYNNIIQPLTQNCLFCGNPNYVKVK